MCFSIPRRDNPSQLSITLHPATAGNKDAQFVCLTLLIQVPQMWVLVYPNNSHPSFSIIWLIGQNIPFACQRGWWCTRIPPTPYMENWKGNWRQGKKGVTVPPPPPPPPPWHHDLYATVHCKTPQLRQSCILHWYIININFNACKVDTLCVDYCVVLLCF